MIDNQLGTQLHDKATRAYPLTSDEIGLLDAWYAHQDAWEADYLAKPTIHNELVDLKNQTIVTIAQVAVVSQQLKQITQENTAIKQEIMSLQRRVSKPT